LAAGVDDLVGHPLELLLGAGVGREGDEAIEDLRHPEAAQLAPHGDARRRRLTREAVGEQDPFQPGHALTLARVLQPWLHLSRLQPQNDKGPGQTAYASPAAAARCR